MIKRSVLLAMVIALAAVPVFAQSNPRMEISGNFGYTLSEGVDVSEQTVIGLIVSEVSPKSGGSYDLNASFFMNEQAQVGFLFGHQFSTLELKSVVGTKHDAADMGVFNYHGVFTYNFGFSDSTVRPFVFGGLGATHYSPSDVMGRSIDSNTRFSTTWGAGAKFNVNDSVGFNFTARWTPTYINSSDAGIWCSPYWPGGCWVLQEANYSNQFGLTGGVNFRF